MVSGDCNVCINGKMPSYSATCVECGLSRKNYKPMTNADRLRAMSDEELAEFFTPFYYDGPIFYCPAVADVGEGACAANYDCRQCWLDWLRQEAPHDQP